MIEGRKQKAEAWAKRVYIKKRKHPVGRFPIQEALIQCAS